MKMTIIQIQSAKGQIELIVYIKLTPLTLQMTIHSNSSNLGCESPNLNAYFLTYRSNLFVTPHNNCMA